MIDKCFVGAGVCDVIRKDEGSYTYSWFPTGRFREEFYREHPTLGVGIVETIANVNMFYAACIIRARCLEEYFRKD